MLQLRFVVLSWWFISLLFYAMSSDTSLCLNTKIIYRFNLHQYFHPLRDKFQFERRSHNICDLHNLNVKPFYSIDVFSLICLYSFTVDVIIDYDGIPIDCKLKFSTETLANKLGLRLIVIHLEFSSLARNFPFDGKGF